MTTTPETPALPGDLTDETIERAARAIYEEDRNATVSDHPWPEWDHISDTLTSDAREPYRVLARAALAAARVAPAQCGEPHPFMEGVCILPAGHEPGHECAPVTPSDTPPEREATPDEAFELGRVAGYDEAMAERTAPTPDREELAQLIQNAEDGDLCANGWTREPGPAQRRAADSIIAALAVPLAPSPGRSELIAELLRKTPGHVNGEGLRVSTTDLETVLGRAFDAGRAAAPSPGREKLVQEVDEFLAFDEGERTLGGPRFVPTMLIQRLRAALAVPPVVNEAKLAEIIREYEWSRLRGDDVGAQLAGLLVERQHEWLETAR